MQSTFEASSDTKEEEKLRSRSDQEDTDHEDVIYAPNPFQGDGRKREAKAHRSKQVVPQDEIDVLENLRLYQDSNPKIIDLET